MQRRKQLTCDQINNACLMERISSRRVRCYYGTAQMCTPQKSRSISHTHAKILLNGEVSLDSSQTMDDSTTSLQVQLSASLFEFQSPHRALSHVNHSATTYYHFSPESLRFWLRKTSEFRGNLLDQHMRGKERSFVAYISLLRLLLRSVGVARLMSSLNSSNCYRSWSVWNVWQPPARAAGTLVT